MSKETITKITFTGTIEQDYDGTILMTREVVATLSSNYEYAVFKVSSSFITYELEVWSEDKFLAKFHYEDINSALADAFRIHAGLCVLDFDDDNVCIGKTYVYNNHFHETGSMC